MSRGVEARRIAYRIARRQVGVVARRQLKERSLSDDLIDKWLQAGSLLRILPGVYSFGRPVDSPRGLWMAGVLHAGDNAVLSGESAAIALGIAPASRPVRCGPIEVARPNGPKKRLRSCPPHDGSVFVFRRASIEAADVIRVGPIPVMEPARLLIDLAGSTTPHRLRRHFIEAGRTGLLTRECLSRIKNRSRGFAGRDALLAVHAKWDPSTGRVRSVLEGEFKLMCAEQGLRRPGTNQMLGGFEVDAVWEDARLIVELDGRQFHGDSIALEADAAKTRQLRRLGYHVLRLTWNDVVEHPERTAHIIRESLG
jgi:hypothetical protein